MLLLLKFYKNMPKYFNSFDNNNFKYIEKIILKNQLNYYYGKNSNYIMLKYGNTIYILIYSNISHYDNISINVKKKIYVNKSLFIQYKSLEDNLLNNINELNTDNTIKKIYIAGHKLGGSLSYIVSSILAEKYHNIFLISCFSFGSYEVGNKKFKKFFNKYVKCIYRLDLEKEDSINFYNYYHISNKLIINDDYITEITLQKHNFFKFFNCNNSIENINDEDIDVYMNKLNNIIKLYYKNYQNINNDNDTLSSYIS